MHRYLVPLVFRASVAPEALAATPSEVSAAGSRISAVSATIVSLSGAQARARQTMPQELNRTGPATRSFGTGDGVRAWAASVVITARRSSDT
ncbi:hypothetical protein CKW46_26775 [Mycobacterium liflandii]|nr:hypothetical protein MMSP_1288 [Mycobacterium sp. 012931]MBC9860614.1 hypothetical protein [Mycobacterium pseudoshottsii]ULL12288.1 hypothetical protein CKW46_26775 [Mycobacterium liflandii]